MNNQEILNLVKQVLTLASGILVARGLLTEGQAQSALSDIAVIAPAAAGLGSIGWSVYAHWNMVKVPEKSAPAQGAGK
jgi:uncharacterized membrane protein YebE (DUF533 family)